MTKQYKLSKDTLVEILPNGRITFYAIEEDVNVELLTLTGEEGDALKDIFALREAEDSAALLEPLGQERFNVGLT